MKNISIKNIYEEYEKSKIDFKNNNKKIYILDVIGKIDPIIISEHFDITIRNLTSSEIKMFMTCKDKTEREKFSKNNPEIFNKVENFAFDDDIINNFFDEQNIKFDNDLIDSKKYQLAKLYLFCKNVIIIDFDYNKVFSEFKSYNSYFYNNNLTYLYENEETATIESFIDGLTKLISIFTSGNSFCDLVEIYAENIKLDIYHLMLYLQWRKNNSLQDFDVFKENLYELKNLRLFFDNNERNILMEYSFIINTIERGLLNDKLILISYVTVLEFLLTAKPDSSGYDESVTRQFIKNVMTCISITADMSQEEFNNLKKELREIYDYRSNIIHGNFEKLEDNLKKLFKFKFYKELRNEINLCENKHPIEETFLVEDRFIIIRLMQVLKLVLKVWLNYPLLIDVFKNK